MRLKKAGAKVMSDPSLEMMHLGYERSFKEWCKKEYWRQHSHIGLVMQQGLSIRLLRFPMLALGHLGLGLMTLIFLAKGFSTCGLFFLSLWFTPSVALSTMHPISRKSLACVTQFTLLYWLRFHIAGISVIREIMELPFNQE